MPGVAMIIQEKAIYPCHVSIFLDGTVSVGTLHMTEPIALDGILSRVRHTRPLIGHADIGGFW